MVMVSGFNLPSVRPRGQWELAAGASCSRGRSRQAGCKKGPSGFPLTLRRTLARTARLLRNMAPASKSDRYFYSTVAFVFLALTCIGFRHFFLEGKEVDGGPIPTSIKVLVI